jgi:hypothetical protein
MLILDYVIYRIVAVIFRKKYFSHKVFSAVHFSSLFQTANNNNVGQYIITILNTIYILSFIHMLKSQKMFLAVIVITNCYLNYSWKNWIGIIFHLFTTVCKYGVSTLQYTLQNMVEALHQNCLICLSRKKYFSHTVF